LGIIYEAFDEYCEGMSAIEANAPTEGTVVVHFAAVAISEDDVDVEDVHRELCRRRGPPPLSSFNFQSLSYKLCG